MATFKVLYWQEIPSQIKAEDADGEVNVSLPPKFLEHIDAMAEKRGKKSADDYLMEWHWSEEEDRPGTAQEVADAVKAELEAKFAL